MKKRTKKKIIKYTKKGVKSVVSYPFKGLIWSVKKTYSLTKSQIEKSKIQKTKKATSKKRPRVLAQYSELKELQHQKGNLTTFETKLYKNKSTIGLILGARGTGKSAIGMKLLENFKIKSNKKLYTIGFKTETLPLWIEKVESIENIENNSVILVDEGGIEFSSRKTMSNANTFLSELLLISRHRDLSIIFVTQNTSNLEINAIRQADYLIMKPSSLLQKDFERTKIKKIYENVADDFEKLDDPGLTYIYADKYSGFISNSLPSFWNENISKSYAKKVK